jgi:hypothetical protein
MYYSVRSVAVTLVLSLVSAGPLYASSTLTLTWDPSVDTVSGYAVYAGVSPGVYTQRYEVGDVVWFTLEGVVPGQQYCFAVAAYKDGVGEGVKSAEVCGYSNQAPTLEPPGDQVSTVGYPVTLQLQGNDPDGQPVSYRTTGLPPGLILGESTGFISGSGVTAGSFAVTAEVSDGVLTASRSFTWTMEPATTPDTTAPEVVITTPTLASTYETTNTQVVLAGTAADDGGVARVDWASDRGGSGTATGTTNWSVASVSLVEGPNVITVMARDPSGNVGTDVLTVTYRTADTSAPTLAITAPTSSSAYTTDAESIALGGTAGDDVGVVDVTWASDRGGSGVAGGTIEWRVPSVTLKTGTNVITVAARDAAGNRTTKTLTVEVTGTAAFTLEARLETSRRGTRVYLTWTAVSGREVDVHRNGHYLTKTRNTGSYTDSPRGLGGSISYQVCVARTTTCSNIAVVTP